MKLIQKMDNFTVLKSCPSRCCHKRLIELCWLLYGWNVAQSTVSTFLLLKQLVILEITSPNTCQCQKPQFKHFILPWKHPCFKQPRVGWVKFRLENNSTVMWISSGGVSLISIAVWFGSVFQYWVTFFCFLLICIVYHSFQKWRCCNFLPT